MHDLGEFFRSPEFAEVLRSMRGEDQRVGKKELEGVLLAPFLDARTRVVGEPLTVVDFFSERPDFVCERNDGTPVGVELAELTNGPDEVITDEQTVEMALHLIGKKDGLRKSPGWQCPDATILVLASAQRSISELAWLLDDNMQPDFADHGFIEVWLADFTGREAYGNIEAFGLYPRRWWGHHTRPNANQKPYG